MGSQNRVVSGFLQERLSRDTSFLPRDLPPSHQPIYLSCYAHHHQISLLPAMEKDHDSNSIWTICSSMKKKSRNVILTGHDDFACKLKLNLTNPFQNQAQPEVSVINKMAHFRVFFTKK